MKLVEILARELKEWPEGVRDITQGRSGILYDQESDIVGRIKYIAENQDYACVSRAQWEAERARIALDARMNDKIAAADVSGLNVLTGSGNSAEELADIACGKRSKEDQEQIKEVTSSVSVGYTLERDYEAEEVKQYDQELRDGIAKELFTRWTSSKSQGAFASIAFDEADAFMAEREKRMKG